MTVAVRGATDLGLKRSQNEDSHACWVPEDPAERERRGILLVVADGMGGTLAGEVASRLAAETVVSTYRSAAGDDILADLYRAVEAANREVHRESQSRPDLNGMGTTCTAVVVRDRELYYAHVGDSRVYLVRGGRIRQLTTDHSLVAQLVQRQQLTPEEARVDPRRNVVTRSVGVGPEVDIDARRLDEALSRGDTLLVCSDGLHGQVTDAELAELVTDQSLDDACRDLIALANDRGGPDNITVVLARVEKLEDALEVPPGSSRRAPGAGGAGRRSSRAMITWIIVVMLVLLVLLMAIILVVSRLGQEAGTLERTARAAPPAGAPAWA